MTLSDNGRYEKQTQYLDRQPQPEVVAGTFSWESDGSTIRLDASGDSQRYFVGENQLTQLYRDGTRPTGRWRPLRATPHEIAAPKRPRAPQECMPAGRKNEPARKTLPQSGMPRIRPAGPWACPGEARSASGTSFSG